MAIKNDQPVELNRRSKQKALRREKEIELIKKST